MSKAKKPAVSFKAGMYLLDSFTSGMYNDPLIVYREYIQNAVDSIDLAQSRQTRPLEVAIQLEPGQRTISVRDNALGVPAAAAEEVLSSIGSSNKTDNGLRGFRGIGRLGGIAFCDKAVFRTKSKKESVVSIQEWDCRSLRRLLSEHRKKSLTLEEVFLRITTFRQEACEASQPSFFEVTLYGVSSFRNQLFDLEKVRRYLSQVAPVPFDGEDFSWSPVIDEYLSGKLSNYGRYNVWLNGQPIYKPYRDKVRITKGDYDQIEGINFFEIKNGQEQPIAYGWYGQRQELLGSIARGDDSSGIRVRAGNIQIGDAHLLDFCFREPRFNAYVAGEVHVESGDLIPNSRRDDFVDNLKKGLFYNLVEREIGIPVSKEIRVRSRMASSHQPTDPKDGDRNSVSVNGNKSSIVVENMGEATPSVEVTNDRAKTEDGSTIPTLSDVVLSTEKQSQLSLLESLQSVCQHCPKLPSLIEILEQT
jgi:hypothetical protein